MMTLLILVQRTNALKSALLAVICTGVFACSAGGASMQDEAEEGSPYLLVLAGDHDLADEDFLVVIDVDPASETLGEPIASLPIGQTNSMPHHMEYSAPPKGEPIFMNAHQPELSLLVDVSNIEQLSIQRSFTPPSDLRFPHDYYRTPEGTRLVSFLRSSGGGEGVKHGGIAEYSADGQLIRQASAAAPGYNTPIRPYAFALAAEQDRLVVTSAPMMESDWADVVQIYRFSDLELLHTIDLPMGAIDGKQIPGSQAAGFGARVLGDGSVFLNSYGCAFYRLSGLDSEAPHIEAVHTIATKPAAAEGQIRGACGVPLHVGDHWIQPVGQEGVVVVLDIADPANPREVSRLETPEYFYPHWLSRDPQNGRLVLGSEMGFEEGFFILRFDEASGELSFDQSFNGKRGSGWRSWIWPTSPGYISFDRADWPHGATGKAWGHAALFLSE